MHSPLTFNGMCWLYKAFNLMVSEKKKKLENYCHYQGLEKIAVYRGFLVFFHIFYSFLFLTSSIQQIDAGDLIQFLSFWQSEPFTCPLCWNCLFLTPLIKILILWVLSSVQFLVQFSSLSEVIYTVWLIMRLSLI